ncbi:MAG: hypothetical protein IKB06_02660 [Clostridia bacterium]|nr:hypothetical protein [Clostridia bacterium]
MKNFILSLLAASAEEEAIAKDAFSRMTGIVNIILPVLMSVILVLAMFYGITLGVKYAKAEEEEDKKKARGALINVIVGALIAILFVGIIQIILNGNYVKRLFRSTNSNAGV